MAARQWTQAQRERQAKLIHAWKPWEKSTGPVTERGKALSSKNALNYASREVVRELAQINRALIPRIDEIMKFSAWLEERGFLDGVIPPPSCSPPDNSVMDGLLDDLERAVAMRFGGD